MAHPAPLEVALADADVRRAAPHVGTDGRLWRERMYAPSLGPLAVPPDVGGPRIRGNVVTLDARLLAAALGALELLIEDAGRRAVVVRSDLLGLQRALASAAERRG